MERSPFSGAALFFCIIFVENIEFMGSLPFSQRLGFKPVRADFQLTAMDDNLRNGIWNALHVFVIEPLRFREYIDDVDEFQNFYKQCWLLFFKLPIDTMPRLPEVDMKKRFYKMEFHEVYDFIEFILAQKNNRLESNDIEEYMNYILKVEMAGYTILNGQVIPITNENELQEISTAQINANELGYKGVEHHLQMAISMLSDRQNPDYRNSIKESISSVESLCKIIAQDPKAELGKAVDKLSTNVPIHGAFKQAIKNLYGYTSDESGIRHSLLELPNLDREDAVFMLVTCSAFINYLIAKADKAGLSLQVRSS